MARIVTGVGPSDARAALEKPLHEAVAVPEDAVFAPVAIDGAALAQLSEPIGMPSEALIAEALGAPVEPAPAPEAAPVKSEPVGAAAPVLDAPVADAKGATA